MFHDSLHCMGTDQIEVVMEVKKIQISLCSQTPCLTYTAVFLTGTQINFSHNNMENIVEKHLLL